MALPDGQLANLAFQGLLPQLKEKLGGQDFTDLSHLQHRASVQESRVLENRDFRERNGKRNVNFVEDSDSASESEEAEVNVAEWVKGSKKPLVCSWLAPKKPAQSKIKYTFDVSKCDQIFDLL